MHYYVRTAAGEDVAFSDDNLDPDATPQTTVKRKGNVFRVKGALTITEVKGLSLDGGVTKLTRAEVNALTPAQLAQTVPFLNTRKVRIQDAIYVAGWDGISPYFEVIATAGYDPFAPVAIQTYDKGSGTFGSGVTVPGIPVSGWPQTVADPPPPPAIDASAVAARDAAAQAKQALVSQWTINACTVKANNPSGYRAWLDANPFPA